VLAYATEGARRRRRAFLERNKKKFLQKLKRRANSWISRTVIETRLRVIRTMVVVQEQRHPALEGREPSSYWQSRLRGKVQKMYKILLRRSIGMT
jgi:hypothetical protein